MRDTSLYRILLCAILFCLGYDVHAQKFPLIHFDVDKGLPSNTVYSITKQKNGYLWFATNKGLSRFDGINFQNFSTFDHLPDNDIFSLREDFEGRLWLATFNGILCFYKNNHFYTPQNTSWLKLPFKSNILRITLQEDGSLNVIFNDQTRFVVVYHDHIKIVPITPIPTQNLYYVKTRKNGNFELNYTDYLILLDSNGKYLSTIRDWRHDKHILIVQNSIETKDEYYGTSHGLYDLNDNLLLKFKKTKVDLTGNVPAAIYNKDVFIGLAEKLSINDSIEIPFGEHVTTIEKDENGDFWIATRGKGVFYLNKHFKDLKEYENAYAGRVVYSRNIKGSLYYITGNASLYKQNNNKIECLYKGDDNVSYLTTSNFIITDEGDFLKITSYKIDRIKNVFSKNSREFSIDIKASSGIKEVLQDKTNLYIAGMTSIERLQKSNLKPYSIEKSDLLISGDPQRNRILSRVIDTADHSIWFSQKNKIFKYKDGKVTDQTQFQNTTHRIISLLGKNMVCITDDNNLIVYNNYNSKNAHNTVISHPNCIWENIYQINDSIAVISTNSYYRVLTLYPSEPGKYTIQAVENPFVPKQAEYITADATNCYFFKNGTLTVIRHNVLLEKTKPPISIFTELKTDDSSYAVDSAIHISYSASKAISIKFDNISFVGKEITVEYSISKSGEDDWNAIDGNQINLNTPGFGEYKIKVRAKTVSSDFSTPAELTLFIEKPFWATWWFISIAFIALLLLMWFTVRFFIKRKLLKRQNEHDAEMKYQQSEYKALNALMNPHFIFNSLNNIQSLINKDSKETANQYLVIFSRLVRQNMINISKGFISLEQELDLVQNYLSLEKLRFKDLVNFSIYIDKNVEMDSIMIPPLLIQPLVENAVLHGLLPKQSEKSMVNISVSEEEDILYVKITDNGIGLTKSLKNKNMDRESYGLINLNKRIEHLGKIQKSEIKFDIKEIFDEQGNSLGTEANISIEL